MSARRRRTVSAIALSFLLGLAAAAPAASVPTGSAADCLSGPIAARYAELGGPTGRLGAPTSCVQPTRDLSGSFATFERGAVYFHYDSGAWDVSGAFRTLWAETGGEQGFLQYPLTGEEPARGAGVYQEYQGGTMLWSPTSGAWPVWGENEAFYAEQGWEWGFLGYPRSRERPAQREGTYQSFQGGTLYRSPSAGTHTVSGAFAEVYAGAGWEGGPLGFPTSQETPTRDGGVFQNYQGGVMYWSPSTGAHTVSGAFLGSYADLGYENGRLGYPTSQELPTRDGVFQRFQGGVMYWSPSTGASPVVDPVLAFYGTQGYETGPLGFPLGYESSAETDGGVHQKFQGGKVMWSAATGTHSVSGRFELAWDQGRARLAPALGYATGQEITVRDRGRAQAFEFGTVYETPSRQVYPVMGAIRAAYAATGYENGVLGYPVGMEHDIPGGRRSDFERGYVEWSAATGARVNAPIRP